MLDQRRVIGAILLGPVDVTDDRRNRPRGGLQCVDARLLKADLEVMNSPDEAIQCAGDGNATLHIRHVRAAVQRMTGTIQFVGDVERWPMAFASF